MHSIITRIFPTACIRHRHLCLYALCVVMSFSIADAEPAESYNHFQATATENYPQSPKQSPEIDPVSHRRLFGSAICRAWCCCDGRQ